MKNIIEYSLCLDTHKLYSGEEQKYTHACILHFLDKDFFAVPHPESLFYLYKVFYLPFKINSKKVIIDINENKYLYI